MSEQTVQKDAAVAADGAIREFTVDVPEEVTALSSGEPQHHQRRSS